VHFYLVNIEDEPVNIDRIAKSGQMFRWKPIEGGWQGNDGASQYNIIDLSETLFEVSSNRPESDFSSLFRLDQNHKELKRELVSRGIEIEPFLENRKGLRMLRANCKTEVLFSFLCSSCNHINRITNMVWHLAGYASEGFPTIQRLAEVTEDQLRARGFGYRGATIPKVAQILHGHGGESYLDDLAKGSYQDARKELITLPGVGKKLADCICLYAFDFGEAVPVDTHIWQVLTKVYHPQWVGTSLTDTKYEIVAGHLRDRFGDLAGVAHQFFFVDNMERFRDRG
jgi:N-glycosylase/DNA lyase